DRRAVLRHRHARPVVLPARLRRRGRHRGGRARLGTGAGHAPGDGGRSRRHPATVPTGEGLTVTATTTIAATPASGPTVRRRPRRPVRIARLLGYVFLIAFAVVQLAPVLLMIMNSFKTDLEVLNHPVGWPEAFRFQNYAEIWDRADFGRYLVNSVLVTLISVAALVLIASMIAFYLARFDFPWNRALLVLFLLGLMVPLRLAVIPIFSLMKDLHLLDSLAGLMVIHVAERLSFAIFVMYGFALSVPREIE